MEKASVAPVLVKKTKILYLITKSSFGGAGRYVYDLATALPKDRFDVAVAFGQIDARPGTLKSQLEAVGIRTIQIQSLERDVNLAKEFHAFCFLITLFLREKPDIIHLNSSKIGGMASLAGRLTDVKKIIFTGHGWAFNEDRNLLSKGAILFLHWLTIVFSHKTIAVSLKTQNQIDRLPFISSKILTIHNGLPIRAIEKGFLIKKVAREALGISAPIPSVVSTASSVEKAAHKTLWIGTVSELHKNKGLDFLIQAVAELKKENGLPHFKVMIIGDGEERQSLESLIVSKKLQDTVILKGFVPDARNYLKAFDIVTLTSRTEALPYALLEAGLAGLPVLASSVGGIPEIIDQLHSGILVKSGNTKEIRDGLSFLLKNSDRRNELGAALKTHVEQCFSLEETLRQTEKLYLGLN